MRRVSVMSHKATITAMLVLAVAQGVHAGSGGQPEGKWVLATKQEQPLAVFQCMGLSGWYFAPSWQENQWSARVEHADGIFANAQPGLPEGSVQHGAPVYVQGGSLLPISNAREERTSVALVSQDGRVIQILDHAPSRTLLGLGKRPHTSAVGTGRTTDPEYLRIDPKLRMSAVFLYERASDSLWKVHARKALPGNVRAAVSAPDGSAVWLVTDDALWRVAVNFDVQRVLKLTHSVRGPSHAVLSLSQDRLLVGMPVYVLEVKLDGEKAVGQRWWRNRACERVEAVAMGCDCLGLSDDVNQSDPK